MISNKSNNKLFLDTLQSIQTQIRNTTYEYNNKNALIHTFKQLEKKARAKKQTISC